MINAQTIIHQHRHRSLRTPCIVFTDSPRHIFAISAPTLPSVHHLFRHRNAISWQSREYKKHTRAAVRKQQEIIRTSITPRARPRPCNSPALRRPAGSGRHFDSEEGALNGEGPTEEKEEDDDVIAMLDPVTKKSPTASTGSSPTRAK